MVEPDEQRVVLYGVTWDQYVQISEMFPDRPALRLTYLEGALEIMVTGGKHEQVKKRIARLIETWSEVRDVDLRGWGSTTFRKAAKERGLEPDECYKLGKLDDDDVPDVAIEVIVSSGLVDKMAVYAGLGVPEVWEWRPTARTLVVHRLRGDAYERHDRSAVLPELDLALLSSFVQPGENQTRLAKAYQAALRAR
jgi:Uma2 family endonuclease